MSTQETNMDDWRGGGVPLAVAVSDQHFLLFPFPVCKGV